MLSRRGFLLGAGAAGLVSPAAAVSPSVKLFTILSGGAELVLNGGFDDASNWTVGANWSISGGVLAAAAAATGVFVRQTVNFANGGIYRVKFIVLTMSAGNVSVGIPGASGTARTAIGSYSEDLTCNASGPGQITIQRRNSDFTGSLDNVSIKRIK